MPRNRSQNTDKQDLQSLIDQTPQGQTLQLAQGWVYVQSQAVTINKPIHIVGNAATLCAERGPVLVIGSDGVHLENLRVEVTDDTSRLSGQQACAILVRGCRPTFASVGVQGTVEGFADEKAWTCPTHLRLVRPLKPGIRHEFKLRLRPTVRAQLLETWLSVSPKELPADEAIISVQIDPLDPGGFFSGAILVKTHFLRAIGLFADVARDDSRDVFVGTGQVIWPEVQCDAGDRLSVSTGTSAVAIELERQQGNELLCRMSDPHGSGLRVRRVAQPPNLESGQIVPVAVVKTLGTDIPVSRQVALDPHPDPREPFYMAFTLADGDTAIVGGLKSAFPRDVTGLRWFVMDGGIRLRWNWPDGCSAALLLVHNSGLAGEPSVQRGESSDSTFSWMYRGHPIDPIRRHAYEEQGDSWPCDLDLASGPWHVKVVAVENNIRSLGEAEDCSCVVNTQPRVRLDYVVYTREKTLVVEWRVDRDCPPFRFNIMGWQNPDSSDPTLARRLLPQKAYEEWPSSNARGVRRWQTSCPDDMSSLYCRLVVDPSDPMSRFVAVRHPPGVFQEVCSRRHLPSPAVFQLKDGRYRIRPQRQVFCPYCCSKFSWWELLLRKSSGQESPLSMWRQTLGRVGVQWGAPPSVVYRHDAEKVCPRYCKTLRRHGPVARLDNALFSCPTVLIGLLGVTRAGKSHWVFSAYRRLVPFGLMPLDEQSALRLKDMETTVVEQKGPLARNKPPDDEDSFDPPILLDARWNDGARRMTLGLFDVAGEICSTFGQAAKQRYTRASQGFVFVVDPLQLPSVRDMLGPRLPPDAPSERECRDQTEVLTNLDDALRRHGSNKCHVPIAVVISKCDTLWHNERLLRESLWEAAEYHPCTNPAYDLSLHWKTQLVARDFLIRHCRNLVTMIEGRFQACGYFCMAPTGSSARAVGKELRFSRFAPWRVEDPILWLFAKLGIIPSC